MCVYESIWLFNVYICLTLIIAFLVHHWGWHVDPSTYQQTWKMSLVIVEVYGRRSCFLVTTCWSLKFVNAWIYKPHRWPYYYFCLHEPTCWDSLIEFECPILEMEIYQSLLTMELLRSTILTRSKNHHHKFLLKDILQPQFRK